MNKSLIIFVISVSTIVSKSVNAENRFPIQLIANSKSDCQDCVGTDRQTAEQELIQQLIEQARKQIQSRQNDRAIASLQKALDLQPQGRNLEIILGLLGNAYFNLEDWDTAAKYYLQAASDRDGDFTIASLYNLVRTYKAKSDWARQQEQDTFNSITFYETEGLYESSRALAFQYLNVLESLDLDSLAQLQVEVLKAELEPNLVTDPNRLLQQLGSLEPSLDKFKVALHLGELLQNPNILREAIVTAQTINDVWAIATANLAQAELLERQDPTAALDLTNQTIAYCRDRLSYSEICFSAYAQAARIFFLQGQEQDSLEYFQEANAYLTTLDPQYFPHEQAENFYYDWIELHLKRNQVNLALEVFGLLQQSQIQKFLEDRCLLQGGEFEIIEATQPEQEALIVTIVTDGVTHIILRAKDQTFHRTVEITREEIEFLTQTWQYQLSYLYGETYLELAEQLYQIIIEPIKVELEKFAPSVLIFNHDRRLRNIPMAALFDGQQYLIEKYPITNVVTANINNKTSPPKTTFLFGLSKATPFSAAIPFVSQELAVVKKKLPDSRLYLNEEFTRQRLLNSFQQDFDILHIATHSRFASSIEDSYIQTFDGRVSFAEIQTQLEQEAFKIDLLVLSACETATGNSISALGIAGFAQQAGAESILASLWQAEDSASAQMMQDFYTFWIESDGVSKAEALQQAQIRQIQAGTKTYAWSNFILIGNWN